AWQDPTHVRAMNENSWIYYIEWFWYLGWFEHRFEMIGSSYLDLKLQPCSKENAAFMRVVLRKVETTARERTLARTMQADLRLPEDAVPYDDTAETEGADALQHEHSPVSASAQSSSQVALAD
ncbi:MAG: hypothetical protein K2X42_02135, partial [Burkholderiaceae bacterium]|nr:hypothetical protein [Burkholderiaceae bacterium]